MDGSTSVWNASNGKPMDTCPPSKPFFSGNNKVISFDMKDRWHSGNFEDALLWNSGMKPESKARCGDDVSTTGRRDHLSGKQAKQHQITSTASELSEPLPQWFPSDNPNTSIWVYIDGKNIHSGGDSVTITDVNGIISVYPL
jgi:hypothetical protein